MNNDLIEIGAHTTCRIGRFIQEACQGGLFEESIETQALLESLEEFAKSDEYLVTINNIAARAIEIIRNDEIKKATIETTPQECEDFLAYADEQLDSFNDRMAIRDFLKQIAIDVSASHFEIDKNEISIFSFISSGFIPFGNILMRIPYFENRFKDIVANAPVYRKSKGRFHKNISYKEDIAISKILNILQKDIIQK